MLVILRAGAPEGRGGHWGRLGEAQSPQNDLRGSLGRLGLPKYFMIKPWIYGLKNDFGQNNLWASPKFSSASPKREKIGFWASPKIFKVSAPGGTPNFFGSFMSPYQPFLLHFYSQNFEIWSFMSGNFFRKISRKFPEIFSPFSKSKSTIIIALNIVQNHYIGQNLAKFSLKSKKTADFSLKT